MAVHYGRGFIGKVKEMGLRPVTIDLGGGITFQGGVSQATQMELMEIMRHCSDEWEDELAALKGLGPKAKKPAEQIAPIEPPKQTAPEVNGTPVNPPKPDTKHDAPKQPAGKVK